MRVLEQGLFRRVPMAGMLALHVWPGLAQGAARHPVRRDPSPPWDSFEITVTGRGGHGSAPERACNPHPPRALRWLRPSQRCAPTTCHRQSQPSRP